MKKDNLIIKKITSEELGERVDTVLSKLFPDYSRNKLTKWLNEGLIKLEGLDSIKPSQKILKETEVHLSIPNEDETIFAPEDINVPILAEEKDFLVIEKPAGMVVHPGAGNRTGTLLNGLLFMYPELSKIPRAGIVHRLDKDTSGLMVVGRNLQATQVLSNQISERTVKRIYEAFTVGELKKSGKINAPLGRHPQNRQKQAVIDNGREAITHYKVITNYGSYSHIEVSLETGRTLQIRVHMNYQGYPLIGDPLYGRRRRFAKGTHKELREVIESFPRQALHASQLSFVNPKSLKLVEYRSNLPEDLKNLQQNLVDQS